MPELHLTDRELLQAADGELARGRVTAVREHLAACWSCRTRMREIEETIGEFVHAYQDSLQVPPAAGPRALLRARMAEVSAASRPALRERMAAFLAARNRLTYAGGALWVIAVAMFVPGLWDANPQAAYMVPDPGLTPGATVPVSVAEVCGPNRPAQASFVPVSVGQEVFASYGIGNPGPRAYELDYLIAPELGGADDPRNFWPQPYSATRWNAHLKDALEEHLHQLVCENRLTLEQAQRDLATDWIAAYKKYFQTQKPIASHEEFLKDHPWGE